MTVRARSGAVRSFVADGVDKVVQTSLGRYDMPEGAGPDVLLTPEDARCLAYCFETEWKIEDSCRARRGGRDSRLVDQDSEKSVARTRAGRLTCVEVLQTGIWERDPLIRVMFDGGQPVSTILHAVAGKMGLRASVKDQWLLLTVRVPSIAHASTQ
jgi:hypothetical protein